MTLVGMMSRLRSAFRRARRIVIRAMAWLGAIARVLFWATIAAGPDLIVLAGAVSALAGIYLLAGLPLTLLLGGLSAFALGMLAQLGLLPGARSPTPKELE